MLVGSDTGPLSQIAAPQCSSSRGWQCVAEVDLIKDKLFLKDCI